MRLNLVAVAYALWLLATEVLFYAYYSGGDDQSTLQISVILGFLPAAAQILFLGCSPYGLVRPVRMALCFLLITLISYLGNAYWSSLVYLASLIFVFAMAILVASSPDKRLLRRIAVIYSVPAALFLLYVAATGEHLWGRLYAHGITPDWWGLVGAGLAMAGLAHKSRLLAALCIAVGFYITYDASARSAMIAILAGLIPVVILEMRALRGARLVGTIMMSLGALLLLMLFSSSIADAVSNLVSSVMLVNDPGRGLGTGLTGRTTYWGEAFQIWLGSPLFGVGFHQHQMLTSDHFEAHQIYLAMLADTGIFGFVWYICFLGMSLYAALHIEEKLSRNAVVGTITAYAALGFFDARGLSSGNPFSLYFEMCCFFALRHGSLQRVARIMSSALPWQSRQPSNAT